MPTSKQDIRDWFGVGVRGGASHLAVVTDTFDYDDFPVYAGDMDDNPYLEFSSIQELLEHFDPAFYRVMEVYRLDHDREAQIAEKRAWNI